MEKTGGKDQGRDTGIPVQKARMAPLSDAPLGREQDGTGRVIPLDQRTRDDQEKAISGGK